MYQINHKKHTYFYWISYVVIRNLRTTVIKNIYSYHFPKIFPKKYLPFPCLPDVLDDPINPLACVKLGRSGKRPGGLLPKRDCCCGWGGPILEWLLWKDPTKFVPFPFDTIELKLWDCPSDLEFIKIEFKGTVLDIFGLESGKPVVWRPLEFDWVKFRFRESIIKLLN